MEMVVPERKTLVAEEEEELEILLQKVPVDLVVPE
jgi:hypothetical protein